VKKVSRAAACLSQLQSLNYYVKVSTHVGELSEEFLAGFSVVVFTECYDEARLVQIDRFCRERKIGFIYTGNLGLYGFAFVDFGNEHKVHDSTGEDPRSAIVAGVTQATEGLVAVHEDKRHGFMSDDYVTFREVKGMTELNG